MISAQPAGRVLGRAVTNSQDVNDPNVFQVWICNDTEFAQPDLSYDWVLINKP